MATDEGSVLVDTKEEKPLELEIINGPSFKNFVHYSEIFSNCPFRVEFRTAEEIPNINPNRPSSRCMSVVIFALARFPNKDKDEDLYGFIAYDYDSTGSPLRRVNIYYCGQYNTRTRKGKCIRIIDNYSRYSFAMLTAFIV